MNSEAVMEGDEASLAVEVVYGDAQRQTLRQLRLAAGATVADAIAAAELERDWPELELDRSSGCASMRACSCTKSASISLPAASAGAVLLVTACGVPTH